MSYDFKTQFVKGLKKPKPKKYKSTKSRFQTHSHSSKLNTVVSFQSKSLKNQVFQLCCNGAIKHKKTAIWSATDRCVVQNEWVKKTGAVFKKFISPVYDDIVKGSGIYLE